MESREGLKQTTINFSDNLYIYISAQKTEILNHKPAPFLEKLCIHRAKIKQNSSYTIKTEVIGKLTTLFGGD